MHGISTYSRISAFALAIGLALAPAQNSAARITRVEAEPAKSLPLKEGQLPYEQIVGTLHGEIDPRTVANRIITDINKAPRNARGMVEYSATFMIERPVYARQANGLLFYDVPNRGYVIVTGAKDDGRVRVMSGWQGDITPQTGLQTATVPVAKGVTGLVLARMVDVPTTAKNIPIIGGFARITPKPIPVSLDTRKAQLRIERRGQADQIVLPKDWAFADCAKTPFPGTPDPSKLCLRAAIDPAAAYVLAYQGKDPLVQGVGFAITRDFIAFLRSGKADDAGAPNPAGNAMHWAVASGTSQSGNFIRSFVHLGFNADESGRQVFDGMASNIAARQVPLNVRFGVPGGAAGTYEPGSEGVLWWGRYDDKARRRGSSSLLDRCTKSGTCPKVIETFGAAEFWGLRASPGLVGTDAKADIPLPANVRRYYFPGVTHAGGRGTGFSLNGETVPPGCVMRGNPNLSSDTFKAAIGHLLAWTMNGKEPPPSQYPTLASGDLVAPNAAAMGWPVLSGVPLPDGHINDFADYDFGKSFNYQDVSGIATRLPPALVRTMPSLVPRVNADGNETSGVPSVQHLVPLGTYTGWNVTASGYDAGRVCGFNGSFIPFARTKAEREAKGDTRPSLEERYTDREGYLAQVTVAVLAQEAAGWLLPEDAARILNDAEANDVLK